MQRWQNEMKHANVDHAGDIGSKTKPWPAPGLRSIFLAVLLRLPRWGPGAIATGILARCQEYTKRMPSGCQGNTKGIPSACHEGCQEDAMWGIFRTYINAGGNTRVFPPLCDHDIVSRVSGVPMEAGAMGLAATAYQLGVIN